MCAVVIMMATHTPCTNSLLSLCRDRKQVAVGVLGHRFMCYVGLISPHVRWDEQDLSIVSVF